VIAQATQTARLGPLVLNNDFRHPAVLAREAVALADLSGGRFELGLGAGYARREYLRAGIAYEPAATRIARLEEAMQILSRLFAGEQVTFNGEYYRVHEDSLQGLQHRVPLLIGGNSPAVHAVAVRYADVLNFVGLSPIRGGTVEDLSDFSSGALDQQVHALSAVGREVGGDLERHVLVQWHEITGDRVGAAERAAKRLEIPAAIVLDSPYVLIGTAEQIAAQARSHHQTFGITRWTIFADHPDLQPAEALAPVISALTS
ncbi:MAG TPA: LLM class flavin-dependent oxidoreductase, partial [Gaiellaceae bacterium]|nr:LLM class flavin-dependent oxidoreductase [Gaiellaceae bacterium]